MSLSDLPLLEPRSSWTPPQLSSLPSWRGAKRVSIDLETHDAKLKQLGPGVRRGASIVGVSFAIEDGPGGYLPFGHEAGGNLDRVQVLAYLRDQARDFTGSLVGANLQYEYDFLEEARVHFRPHRWLDVLVAEPLIDELQNGYGLDDVLGRHGLPGKDEAHLRAAAAAFGLDPKAGLWRLHSKHVGAYGEADARKPLALLRRQERIIAEQDLEGIFDLESRLLPVLVKMRRRGVRISFDRLAQTETRLGFMEEEVLAEVKRLTGISLSSNDLWTAGPLAKVLEHVGVDVPLTPATKKPSVTKELLDSIEHPVAGLLRRSRQINKVRTSYVASMREHAIGDRIHPTFNQLRKTDDEEGGDDSGARYGRLSSCDPNLQQQPARDPVLGPMWRSNFLPDGDLPWACHDYSQQEIRWLVHWAFISNCEGAAAARQRYIDNPRLDYHEMSAEWTGLKRKDAKEILLGRCYGMGGGKMCRKLKLPTVKVFSRRQNKMVDAAGPEGEAVLLKFDSGMPFVRAMAKRCEDRAAQRGFIRTVLGRRCRFPPNGKGGWDWCHKALNRLIQGSSGDQTKKAMVDADDASIPLQLQVHDELDLSSGPETSASLSEIMRDAVPCEVPMKVDAETGPSWGEIK
jgi:DNA polymerase I-like protein with 3'-5' exonuclease and polymerase domains